MSSQKSLREGAPAPRSFLHSPSPSSVPTYGLLTDQFKSASPGRCWAHQLLLPLLRPFPSLSPHSLSALCLPHSPTPLPPAAILELTSPCRVSIPSSLQAPAQLPSVPRLLELSNSQHCPHPSTTAPRVFPTWIHNPLAACGRARTLGSLHTSLLHPRTHVSCCFYWVSSCPQVRPPHLSRALFQALFHWSLATSLATSATLRPRKPQRCF